MKMSSEWINRGQRKSSRLYKQRICFSHVHDAEILRSRSLASPWSHSTSHKALLGGLLPRKFRACWCHAATVDISRSTPQVCSVCRDSYNGGARRGTSQNCTNRGFFSSLRYWADTHEPWGGRTRQDFWIVNECPHQHCRVRCRHSHTHYYRCRCVVHAIKNLRPWIFRQNASDYDRCPRLPVRQEHVSICTLTFGEL